MPSPSLTPASDEDPYVHVHVCGGDGLAGHTKGMTVLPLPQDRDLEQDIDVSDLYDLVNVDAS